MPWPPWWSRGSRPVGRAMTEAGAGAGAGPWLVVIDPQWIFADPASDWVAPRFAEIETPIADLVAEFGDRTVVTRWVPPEVKVGSWLPYFETYPFADLPGDDPAFDLVDSVAALQIARSLAEPTFGKWAPALEAMTGPAPELVLAGVATDCCVISTALAAADAGATVQIAAWACAGSDDTNHERALAAMALYAPQITVRRSREDLAGR